MKKLSDYTTFDYLNWIAIAMVLFSCTIIITRCATKN